MSIQVGDIAPDFTLYNTEKEAVTLSSLRGQKVCLLFFPLAFTSTCTAELCSVRDDIGNYSQADDAIVFGISVDTPQTLKRFKDEQNLNFELLSDFNKEVSKAYDAQYEVFSVNLRGVAKRSAFVIDREGIIRYAEVLEKAADLPNMEAVKSTIKSI